MGAVMAMMIDYDEVSHVDNSDHIPAFYKVVLMKYSAKDDVKRSYFAVITKPSSACMSLKIVSS